MLPLLRTHCSIGLTRCVSAGWLLILQSERAPSFEKVLPLPRGETVFAYARISPDGRQLLYAREARDSTGKAPHQTVRLIVLSTGKATFEAPGVDAYWAPDGERFIYQSIEKDEHRVNIWNQRTKVMLADVAPPELGDYYSWGTRGARDVILTINNFYYLLGETGAELPAHAIPSCPGIGVGERPLLSKNGLRVTTFVQGTILVRNLADCDDIIHTNLAGAKADFSWDGRYIAFHSPRASAVGYDIQVVDLVKRTVRSITASLPGSSFFPSWTADGRLCFRYEGSDYNGFMIAENVLNTPARPLPDEAEKRPMLDWASVFISPAVQPNRVSLVLVWSTWIAHSPAALADFQQAQALIGTTGRGVGFFTASEPYSNGDDARSLFQRYGITLPRIRFHSGVFRKTDAVNQIPTTLMFIDGQLVDRRLGAQTANQLIGWIGANATR